MTLVGGPALAQGGGGDMGQDPQQFDRRGRPMNPGGRPAPTAIDPNTRREQERDIQRQRRESEEHQRRTQNEQRQRDSGERQQREAIERQQRERAGEQQRREAERQQREGVERQQREAIERQQRERSGEQQRREWTERQHRGVEQPQRRDWSERQQRERVEEQRREAVQHRAPDRRDWNGRDWSHRDSDRRGWRDSRWWGPSAPPPRHYYAYVNRRPIFVAPERRRHYRNIVIVRPYGHFYTGYGRYYSDADAYRWLGLTAISLGVLAVLNESQQRSLEHAQVLATTAPIGQPITWWDQGAGGHVVATQDGWTETGLYCREFQQTVEIGGRREDAYGTACQQPDGAWQVTAS